MLQEIGILSPNNYLSSNNFLSTNSYLLPIGEQPMSETGAFVDSHSYMHGAMAGSPAQQIYYNNLPTPINSSSASMIGSSLSTTSASNCSLPAISSLYRDTHYTSYTGKRSRVLVRFSSGARNGRLTIVAWRTLCSPVSPKHTSRQQPSDWVKVFLKFKIDM